MKKGNVFSDSLTKELQQLALSNQHANLNSAKEMGDKLANIADLLAVSPIDGRYASTGEKLNEYFSEARENVTFTQFFKENFVELTTSLYGYFEMYEFYEED